MASDPEKTLPLVYGPFYLAINVTFYELIKLMTTLLHKSRKIAGQVLK